MKKKTFSDTSFVNCQQKSYQPQNVGIINYVFKILKYCLLNNKKATLKIFGPRTWSTKIFLIIKVK